MNGRCPSCGHTPPSLDRVELASLFGVSSIPVDASGVIAEAVDAMVKNGDVSDKARWQAIEFLAAQYLAENGIPNPPASFLDHLLDESNVVTNTRCPYCGSPNLEPTEARNAPGVEMARCRSCHRSHRAGFFP